MFDFNPMFYESIADFEAPRAKCLSFHPIKPILLSSHHTSQIFAYDLHLASHVHTFLGHDGPVRAVMFHPTTDIFVSGGDDCKIILWSYSKKSILCTLKGHTDYIRSVDFHPTQPWVLSSSDDQTIRIWNLQSQKLLACVSGHSHYVMCVRFVGDFIVSCSLDQTLRVWDYSGLTLRKENSLLGVPNVVVKQILDAHDRGINHVVTHETKNKFLTCGDDRQVKLWEFGDTVWERESFYSHQGNVSGACFIKDNIVSVGEDGVICMGDTRVKFDTRFWCVAKNRDESLMAFGHDTGIKLFSTVQKGVVYAYDGMGVYYKTEISVVYNDLETENEVQRIKKPLESVSCLSKDCEGEYKDCYLVQESNRFDVFRNKECIYKGNGKGLLLNDCIVEWNKNELRMNGTFLLDAMGVKALFYHNKDSFFIVKEKGVEIYNINDKKIKASIVIHDIEKIRVGKSIIALIGRRRISFMDQKLKIVGMIDEMIEVTDGFFLDNVLFYATLRHIKFAINNYSGILRSIEKEVYPLFLQSDFVFYITKEGLENVNVDLTEYSFELALEGGDRAAIHDIISKGVLPIEIIIDRLIKKDLSDVALPYIKERKGDFLFEMNKLDECYEDIKEKSDNQMFERLFEKSMKMKNYDVAEKCLRQLKDYKRLMMLFACRNQKEKMVELKDVEDVNVGLNVGVVLKDVELVLEILTGKHKKIRNEVQTKKSSEIKNASSRLISKKVTITHEEEKKLDLKRGNNVVDEVPIENNIKTTSEENIKCELNTEKVIPRDEEEDSIDSGCNTSEFISKDENPNEVGNIKDSLDTSLINESIEAMNLNECTNDDTSEYTEHSDIEDSSIHNEDFIKKSSINPEYVITNLNYQEAFDSVIVKTTDGKFTSALSTCHEIVHTLATHIKSTSEHIELRTNLGIYISGLTTEKRKKKVADPTRFLVMSSYFPSLPLQPVHKNLALSNFMILCYKNENYDQAKKIATLLLATADGKHERNASKILKSNKSGDKHVVSGGGYCFDVADYRDVFKTCQFCYVNSEQGDVCSVCEVGLLK